MQHVLILRLERVHLALAVQPRTHLLTSRHEVRKFIVQLRESPPHPYLSILCLDHRNVLFEGLQLVRYEALLF